VSVNFWLLPVALLLLWFPRQWLSVGKLNSVSRFRSQKRSRTEVRNQVWKPKAEYTKPRNWVDFFRALAGGLAVSYLCFEAIPGAAYSVAVKIFALQAAIMLLAVIIQSMRLGSKKITLVAPVYFIAGLSFGLIGWKAAVFVCVVGLILNQLLPGPGLSLFVFGCLEVGFGMMLSRAPLRMGILAVALAMTPILLSGMTKRSLVRLNKPQTKPM
jgi:hypothetical protein